MTSIFAQKAIMEIGTTQTIENNCSTGPTEYETDNTGACMTNANYLYAQNIGTCTVTATNGDCETNSFTVEITEDGKPNIFTREDFLNINILEVSMFLIIASTVAFVKFIKKI